jgi:hypothetical protein
MLVVEKIKNSRCRWCSDIYFKRYCNRIFQSSDLRLKDIISREDTVRFTWKDKRDELVHIGYVAQEVQENYPDQVKEYKEMLSINYIEVLVAKFKN